MSARSPHFVLTISIVLMLISAPILVLVPEGASALQEGDFEYELTGDPPVAKITKYIGAGGAVNVPSTLGGYPTAIVGHDSFNNAHGGLVTSVLLPSSVLTVENYAFANCDLLASVSISSGVTFIGEQAFHNCYSLGSITVKGANTMYSSIDGVLYDKNLTTLIKCPAAKAGEVIIPDSVTSMVWRAFDHCWSLQHLTIGSGIAIIDGYAFEGCRSLETLAFSPGIELGSIGTQAFSLCTSLLSVELPEGLLTIGSSAFQGCVSMVNVSIPASVTSIARNAFYRCSNLTAMDVSEGNLNYSSIDGVLYNRNASLLIQCPSARSGSFEVPASVTEIGEGAFATNNGITAVSMEAGVTTIGEHSFLECYNLTEVTLGAGVVVIGRAAFASCLSLGSVVIPSAVNKIGDLAFHGCLSLANITFPGLRSPEVVGYEWVGGTNPMLLLGHADPDSNFPVPGSTFYGLTMGPNVGTADPGTAEEDGDHTTVLLLIMAVLLAVIALLMVLLVRKGQGGP